jgi:tubulin polyglutamylase TTLL6/13
VGPQKGNLDNLFMHLTNYAIQKKSDAFVKNADEEDNQGHKRSLSSILEYLREKEPGF